MPKRATKAELDRREALERFVFFQKHRIHEPEKRESPAATHWRVAQEIISRIKLARRAGLRLANPHITNRLFASAVTERSLCESLVNLPHNRQREAIAGMIARRQV
jgi:hypothetical protein